MINKINNITNKANSPQLPPKPIIFPSLDKRGKLGITHYIYNSSHFVQTSLPFIWYILSSRSINPCTINSLLIVQKSSWYCFMNTFISFSVYWFSTFNLLIKCSNNTNFFFFDLESILNDSLYRKSYECSYP